MNIISLTLALVLLPASAAGTETLYSVDMSKVLDAAARGLKEVYPEISPDDVELANDVWLHCRSTRSSAHVYTPVESFEPCEALVEFDLSATRVEHTSFNRDGHCVRVTPPGVMYVYVSEDGSSRSETFKGRNSAVEVLECTEEVMARLAEQPTSPPGEGKAFTIDPRRVLQRAFAAAIEERPETAPEDLDFEGQLSLFCDVTVPADGRVGRDVLIRPCTVELSFYDRSTPLEKGYIHQGGRCFVGPTFGTVRVHLDADGNAQVGRADGPWAQVACDEEFHRATEEWREQAAE